MICLFEKNIFKNIVEYESLSFHVFITIKIIRDCTQGLQCIFTGL